jgi:hypothetical protein
MATLPHHFLFNVFAFGEKFDHLVGLLDSISRYKLHSSSDFEKLKAEITTRQKAQAKKAEARQTVAAMSEMQTTEGLSSHEIAALVTIMSERSNPDDGLSTYKIRESMHRSGYTPMAVSLALESLVRKTMIEYFNDVDFNGETFTSCRLTSKGIDWLLVNQGRFRLRKDEEIESSTISDEDIPF